MLAVLQMLGGICMDISLTEPEILAAQNSANLARSEQTCMHVTKAAT